MHFTLIKFKVKSKRSANKFKAFSEFTLTKIKAKSKRSANKIKAKNVNFEVFFYFFQSKCFEYLFKAI